MINIKNIQTHTLSKVHEEKLLKKVYRRAELIYPKDKKRKLGKRNFKKLLEFIEKNGSEILSGDRDTLKRHEINLRLLITDHVNLTKDLNNIYSYSSWFRNAAGYNSFDLAKSLQVDVCPYCNRNYTTSHTVDGTTKNVFPEFDHYYPQNDFPLLALSFFNLIPSCNVCNSHYKGASNPDFNNIYYPYSDFEAVKHFNFDFTPLDYKSLIGKAVNFEINVNTTKYKSDASIRQIVTGSLAFFDIIGTYNANHKELIKSLIDKRINYSDTYIKSLLNYGITKEQAYHILFESYYEDEKLIKRPFSKLKKDIFDEVKSLM